MKVIQLTKKSVIRRFSSKFESVSCNCSPNDLYRGIYLLTWTCLILLPTGCSPPRSFAFRVVDNISGDPIKDVAVTSVSQHEEVISFSVRQFDRRNLGTTGAGGEITAAKIPGDPWVTYFTFQKTGYLNAGVAYTPSSNRMDLYPFPDSSKFASKPDYHKTIEVRMVRITEAGKDSIERKSDANH